MLIREDVGVEGEGHWIVSAWAAGKKVVSHPKQLQIRGDFPKSVLIRVPVDYLLCARDSHYMMS